MRKFAKLVSGASVRVTAQVYEFGKNGVMIDRRRLADALKAEEERFIKTHKRSGELAKDARASMLSGVPMAWMTRWPGAHPIFVDSAAGVNFTDVDGNEYVDFCLGDTGAMTGHSSTAVAEAISRQANRGLTTMLPSSDSIWVSENLAKRFDLPIWQYALSATDANRFVLRYARQITGRPMIVVHDWCYHGTVDETLVILDADNNTVSRPGAIGPQVDPGRTTRAVPFNDIGALEDALAKGDVACVLIEPALTNIGIVLPDSGYHDKVRDVTKRHGVLLVVDETHTICAGPGGCTRAMGLEPDLVVVGKTIGGGVPVGAFGMTTEVAERIARQLQKNEIDVGGVGGTLTGSALAMAAMRATLSTSLLPEQFAATIDLATKWASGVKDAYTRHGLDWHVQQLGCRAEYLFGPPPRNGAQAAASTDHELESFLHLYALNRGILLTPFHNMALFAPQHQLKDVDTHTAVFAEGLKEIVAH